jgi:hypothetical protein
MILCIGLFILSMVQYHGFTAKYPERKVPGAWSPAEADLILSRIGLSLAWWVEWNFVSSILFAVLMSGIGLFLYFRKSRDWFGLYLAVAFVMFGTLANGTTGVLSILYPRWEPVLNPMGVIPWMGFIFIFYLFPNGSFYPRWAKWAGLLVFISFGINQVANHGASPPDFLLVPMMLLIAIGPVSQVFRYFKVSNPVERQQTKWVMLAMLFVMATLLTGLLQLISPESMDPGSTMAPVMVMLNSSYFFIMGLIPISITIAILRYRLWDVDVLIRKTLVYALLSGLLGLVYFGSVALLQGTLVTDRGKPSAIVIVVTTLAIAALFNPLRRRLQEIIDRRFYRQKYDSEKALAEFAAAARSENDLVNLSSRLTGTVQETMQPVQVGLWLQQSKGIDKM